MKQHITKEQWDELSDEQKDIFLGLGKNEILFAPNDYINIGTMIEFLGDDWYMDKYLPKNRELCDWLWLAVKNKLNK